MTCCPPGSYPYLAATYEATGTVVKEGDYEYYINKGVESPTSAIIMCPDVWGWNGGRMRAVADHFCSKYLVVVPKYLADPCFEGGTDGDAMSPTSQFNMDWIKNYPYPVQKPKIDGAIKICTDAGCTKIGVFGFCYGGHPASYASSENPELIKCGVVFHPSMQLETFAYGGKMEDMMARIQCPFLFCPAGNDLPMFAEDSAFGVAVKASAKGSECVWKPFPEMAHGWTCRGDLADDAVKRDVEGAMKEAEDFVAKYL